MSKKKCKHQEEAGCDLGYSLQDCIDNTCKSFEECEEEIGKTICILCSEKAELIDGICSECNKEVAKLPEYGDEE